MSRSAGRLARRTDLVLCYRPVATIYRILVTVGIALFIAGRFFIAGVVLALWGVGATAAFPVLRAVRHVTSSPRLRRHRTRAIGGDGRRSPLVLALLLLGVPMPLHTNAEGVSGCPTEAIVRAGGTGFRRECPGRAWLAGAPPGSR